jgi:hypothetical protein
MSAAIALLAVMALIYGAMIAVGYMCSLDFEIE